MWSQSQKCIYNLSPKQRHFESEQGATDAASREQAYCGVVLDSQEV